MSQAARLQQTQRHFDLVVTNVPGPQVPLYLLGRRLRALYPVVPITGRHALGIAVMSYDGRLGLRPARRLRRAARRRASSRRDLREAIDALVGRRVDPAPRRARAPQGSRAPVRVTSALSMRRAAVGVGVLVLAVAGVVALIAILDARDDSTVGGAAGPGVARAPGARPVVAPGNVVLLYSDERLTAALRELALDDRRPRRRRRSSGRARPSSSAARPGCACRSSR